MKLTKKELMNIEAGAGITATLLGYIIRGINTILDLGRSAGTAIRRVQSGNLCPL